MSERIYSVTKLGMEDLVDTETAQQVRGDSTVIVTGVFARTIRMNHTTSQTIEEKFAELEQRITDLEAL